MSILLALLALPIVVILLVAVLSRVNELDAEIDERHVYRPQDVDAFDPPYVEQRNRRRAA